MLPTTLLTTRSLPFSVPVTCLIKKTRVAKLAGEVFAQEMPSRSLESDGTAVVELVCAGVGRGLHGRVAKLQQTRMPTMML